MTATKATATLEYFASDAFESLSLPSGMTVLLNRFEAAEPKRFHHVEAHDVLGIGFHLQGGARFEMGSRRMYTESFDIWVGTSPRGSESFFTLPPSGFRTVSLRFIPDAASAWLAEQGLGQSSLASLASVARTEVEAVRLARLDSAAARIVEAMFAAPYTGTARRLFLESAALALLASQCEARANETSGERWSGRELDRKHLMKARSVLEGNLVQPPSIAALARIVGMNEFKLKRDFKQLFGTTIFGYVRKRRMELAAMELHAGLPVAQAAAAVGYQCPRCFADAFRRHFGTLPSEVSRSVLRKLPLAAG